MYNEYKEQGFEVVFTLYVDKFDRPLFEDPSLEMSHKALFISYQNTLGSTWPLLADIGWQLEPFFDTEGLPLVMLVTTEDMQIRHASVGHHSEMLKTMAEEILAP